MTRSRRNGLVLLLLGAIVFLSLGFLSESALPGSMSDFKTSYYGAKCLLRHCDPYNQDDLTRLYHTEEGARSSDSVMYRMVATVYVYPPPSLAILVPFAIWHYGPAHILWMAATAAGFLVAAFLMWNFGADYSPVVAGCLVGLLLANSEWLIFHGNPAGIAISLAIVAAWCFIRERYVPAGIVCLAISLAMKPQDAGLIWLFFLLAGGTHRRRALLALALVIALSLPTLLWVNHLSPHWMQELRSNLVLLSARGGMIDPGPASSAGHGWSMITDLQTVISEFWDDPRVYNPVSYIVCGSLLLVWTLATLRNRPSTSKAWFGLAAIAALTMLPVYHRQNDAKLILLTVPACVLAWSRGGLSGRIALWMNVIGFLIVGDPLWIIVPGIFRTLPISHEISPRILMMFRVFPIPLMLLTMGTFYLWLYLRWSPTPVASTESHRASAHFLETT